MEEEPTFENQENKESAEQRLVRLLKEKGVEDPEARNLLDSWTREQEKQVEQSDDYHFEQIQFNLRRARLYFKAGYIEESIENFEDARMYAWNEQREDLYQEIMEEMDRVEDSIKHQE